MISISLQADYRFSSLLSYRSGILIVEVLIDVGGQFKFSLLHVLYNIWQTQFISWDRQAKNKSFELKEHCLFSLPHRPIDPWQQSKVGQVCQHQVAGEEKEDRVGALIRHCSRDVWRNHGHHGRTGPVQERRILALTGRDKLGRIAPCDWGKTYSVWHHKGSHCDETFYSQVVDVCDCNEDIKNGKDTAAGYYQFESRHSLDCVHT